MRNVPPVVAAALALACEGALPPGPDARAQQDLSAPQATVVLMHGMGSFHVTDDLDYFYGVPDLWTQMGADVFVPDVTAFQTIEDRAAEVKRQLDALPGPMVIAVGPTPPGEAKLGATALPVGAAPMRAA